jgi:hypothetical protein
MSMAHLIEHRDDVLPFQLGYLILVHALLALLLPPSQ